MTSAVESLDDDVLARLEKGHTRADFERVVALCREAGLPLVADVRRVHAVDDARRRTSICCTRSIASICRAASRRFSSRSACSCRRDRACWSSPEMRACAGAFDPVSLTYPWTHPDPAVDALQADADRARRRAAQRAARGGLRAGCGRPPMPAPPWRLRRAATRSLLSRAAIPYLNEPWYC